MFGTAAIIVAVTKHIIVAAAHYASVRRPESKLQQCSKNCSRRHGDKHYPSMLNPHPHPHPYSPNSLPLTPKPHTANYCHVHIPNQGATQS